MASEGEKRIGNMLKGLDVIYECEKTFPQCRDRKTMPFDFYVVCKGRVGLIEYDGRQHFEICPNFHGNNHDKAAAKFQKQQEHDLKKNQFTKDYNISLLRISYKEHDHIEKHVREFLDKMDGSRDRVEIFTNGSLYSNPYGESGYCIIS